MNDLQIWPRAYPKEYDTTTLKPGDILEYLAGTRPGVLYEFVGVRNHDRGPHYFSTNLVEYCKPREYEGNIDPVTFPYGEDHELFPKRFALHLKLEDKVLKSNMCKVIAAKFFMAEELNNLLVELEI